MAGAASKLAFQQMFSSVTKTQRATALEILTGLTRTTPVDTGRAASSWRLNKGVPDPSFEPAGQTSYKPPLPPSGASLGTGETLFISNNLPYIVRLNEGHSEKAGPFFVEQEVALATARIKSAGI